MTKKPMVNVSTKTGDGGETGLANGQRLAKDAVLFEVLGTLDELSSWLGLVLTLIPTTGVTKAQRTQLLRTQEDLFYIGAELAGSVKTKLSPTSLKKLESNEQLWQLAMADGWTSKFLFPGGTPLAAHLDVARTVARRLERVAVHYSRQHPVRPLVLQYLNRLSDVLYVLRCWANESQHVLEKQFIAR